MSHIELNILDAQRIVEIWLTSAEKKDPQVQALLQPIYTNYTAEKYKVAVFCSGQRDLLNSTTGLLLHNRTA